MTCHTKGEYIQSLSFFTALEKSVKVKRLPLLIARRRKPFRVCFPALAVRDNTVIGFAV